MSWETQHKSRNPADGIIRPFTACNDIHNMRHGASSFAGVHMILICCCLPYSHLMGFGLFVLQCLQTKGNPPLGRTPTAITKQLYLCFARRRRAGPEGIPHRVQGSMREWRARPLVLSIPSLCPMMRQHNNFFKSRTVGAFLICC